jgi:hypothetical protein
MPQGYPWGGNKNPYTDLPNTGVTRHYDFTLAPATIAPDGVERPAYLINGMLNQSFAMPPSADINRSIPCANNRSELG